MTVSSHRGGSFYFWSETGKRDGGFPHVYADKATGGHMFFDGYRGPERVDVYKIDVNAGEPMQLPIGEHGRFTGGFAWIDWIF